MKEQEHVWYLPVIRALTLFIEQPLVGYSILVEQRMASLIGTRGLLTYLTHEKIQFLFTAFRIQFLVHQIQNSNAGHNTQKEPHNYPPVHSATSKCQNQYINHHHQQGSQC